MSSREVLVTTKMGDLTTREMTHPVDGIHGIDIGRLLARWTSVTLTDDSAGTPDDVLSVTYRWADGGNSEQSGGDDAVLGGNVPTKQGHVIGYRLSIWSGDWHAICTCTWSGPGRGFQDTAREDGDQHLREYRP